MCIPSTCRGNEESAGFRQASIVCVAENDALHSHDYLPQCGDGEYFGRQHLSFLLLSLGYSPAISP